MNQIFEWSRLKLLQLRLWRRRRNKPAPKLSIQAQGDSTRSAMTAQLHRSFDMIQAGHYKEQWPILSMDGMSGRRYRAFINHFVSAWNGKGYLEVGSYKGSTVIAALHDNEVPGVCIDNFSMFGGPKDEFLTNTTYLNQPAERMRLVEQNLYEVDFSSLGEFDVYFFDGPHGHDDQRDGLIIALSALADEFLFVVDDWNRPEVRNGTMEGIAQGNLKVLYSITIRTSDDDTQPELAFKQSDWHNGYYMAVIAKP